MQAGAPGPRVPWRERAHVKKSLIVTTHLVMGDGKADEMTLWQRSQEEASSHARGRDGGMDKQMLFITQGWWGGLCVGLRVYTCPCVFEESQGGDST